MRLLERRRRRSAGQLVFRPCPQRSDIVDDLCSVTSCQLGRVATHQARLPRSWRSRHGVSPGKLVPGTTLIIDLNRLTSSVSSTVSRTWRSRPAGTATHPRDPRGVGTPSPSPRSVRRAGRTTSLLTVGGCPARRAGTARCLSGFAPAQTVDSLSLRFSVWAGLSGVMPSAAFVCWWAWWRPGARSGAPGFLGSWVDWDGFSAQVAGRGRAASLANALVSSCRQGQFAAIRKRSRRPPRVIRAAACSSRLRSFFGSAVASSPSSSRTRVQASRSIAVKDSSSQAWLMAKWREGKRPKPVALPSGCGPRPGHARGGGPPGTAVIRLLRRGCR